MQSTLVKTIKNKERIFINLRFLTETYFLIEFSQPSIHTFSMKGQFLQKGNCCVTSADQVDIYTTIEAPIQKNIQAYT